MEKDFSVLPKVHIRSNEASIEMSKQQVLSEARRAAETALHMEESSLSQCHANIYKKDEGSAVISVNGDLTWESSDNTWFVGINSGELL